MTKFRKKPVVIDAVQYFSPHYNNIIEFIESNYVGDYNDILVKVYDNPNEHRNISNMSGTSHLAIKTLEGNMKITNKDWIIKGVNGEFYPCKPDIFEKTYEKLE